MCGAVLNHCGDRIEHAADGAQGWIGFFETAQAVEMTKQLVRSVDEMNDHEMRKEQRGKGKERSVDSWFFDFWLFALSSLPFAPRSLLLALCSVSFPDDIRAPCDLSVAQDRNIPRAGRRYCIPSLDR